jgi:hypothetical protein
MIAAIALIALCCMLTGHIISSVAESHGKTADDYMLIILPIALCEGFLGAMTFKHLSKQIDAHFKKLREQAMGPLDQAIKTVSKMDCEMTIRSLSGNVLKIEASWCDTPAKVNINIQGDITQIPVATLFDICEKARAAGERREKDGMV